MLQSSYLFMRIIIFLRDFNPDNLGEPQNYFSHASNGSENNFARTDKTLINFDDFKGDLINKKRHYYYSK